MPFFHSSELDIYFETSATEGQPKLLYISGTGADLRKKPSIFDGPLPKLFQLLAYDQRGLGRSDKPDRNYSMSDYASDALRLLDHLGWESAHVLGVSFGGMVAQELAVNHCDRIDRLVLCCTSSGGEGGSSYPLHTLHTLSEEEKARKMMSITDLRCDEQWAAKNPELYSSMINETLAASQFADDEENHTIGAQRQIEARQCHNTYDRLPAISCPTLVCGGQYDGLATPANLTTLAEKIPAASLEFFAGGHMFLLQDPSAFPRIIKFLRND